MKSISRTLIMLGLAMTMVFGLAGCTQETIVATINNEKISDPLYRIFLWSAQRGLESIVPNIWEVDPIGGKTPEELAKESALKSITYYVAVRQKAEEAEIKLTKAEKNEVKKLAKDYMASNSELVTTYGIRQKDVERFLEYGKLEEKLISELGDTYMPNESEVKEAKQALQDKGEFAPSATITHVLIKNKDEQGNVLPSDKDAEAKEKAESILEQALAGEDMTKLAEQYSEDSAVHLNNGRYTFKQNDMESTLEEVVFGKAVIGEVYPKLVETEMGYEIIKVEEVKQVDELQMAEEATKKIRQEFINHELTELSETYKIEKTKAYEEIHIMNVNN